MKIKKEIQNLIFQKAREEILNPKLSTTK